jgi:predicted AAA+ superfamily ATPase
MTITRRLKTRALLVLELAERFLKEALGSDPDASLFERHLAFRWAEGRWQGRLVPIPEPACFDLDDLIGVDESVAGLDRNTRQFLAGLPFNDVLLHGERGTGKSSAVRGLLARYADAGLRIVEVDRADLVELPNVLAALRPGRAHFFLIFCDDLSFGPGEGGYRELKAALEGSLEQPPGNVCIVATSNRRHLVPETMLENRAARVDAAGELHLGEALEEKLALADRFGLVLGFYNFDQNTYLEIVRHYLERDGDRKLDGTPPLDGTQQLDGTLEPQELNAELREEALRWALRRGSRSGRTARQFVDDVIGRRRLEAL